MIIGWLLKPNDIIIDKNEINNEIKRPNAKTNKAYDTSKILKNYLALQNITPLNF